MAKEKVLKDQSRGKLDREEGRGEDRRAEQRKEGQKN